MSSPLAFDVKRPELVTDPLRGLARVHPSVIEGLNRLCAHGVAAGWPRLTVTCFGRLRDDQEALYLPGLLQLLDHEGLGKDPVALEAAHQAARNRFSWHCLAVAPDGATGHARALDLRSSALSEEQRLETVRVWRGWYGSAAEALYHAVVGGGVHLHLGLKDPAGRPADWL